MFVAIIDEEVLVYERVKKKGYIRLTTNKGILNLELHCEMVRVVGGLETLNKMEKIETDDNDKPLEDIIIEDTIVFVDPFKEAEELLKKEREDEIKKEEEEKAKLKSWKVEKKSSEENNLVAFKQGVGKYINPSVMKRSKESDTSDVSDTTKKKTKLSTGFGDFSTW
uniref:Uncharacterized protein n=1 Tax=Octopus bimaculoides TaxID=37653 RepID=A0A0L8H2N3_OCTBM